MHSIDFYSGSKKKNSRGVQFEILNKSGIHFYIIVASGKPLKGGAILIPKKVPPPLTSKPGSAYVNSIGLLLRIILFGS